MTERANPTPRRCIGYGARTGNCTNPAGTPWSSLWCDECDAQRRDILKRRDASLPALRDAFHRALAYAQSQDARLHAAGIPPLAEQDASQAWRAQRAAFTVAGLIEPGPDETGWLDLVCIAVSALVALDAEAVKVHTGSET